MAALMSRSDDHLNECLHRWEFVEFGPENPEHDDLWKCAYCMRVESFNDIHVKELYSENDMHGMGLTNQTLDNLI